MSRDAWILVGGAAAATVAVAVTAPYTTYNYALIGALLVVGLSRLIDTGDPSRPRWPWRWRAVCLVLAVVLLIGSFTMALLEPGRTDIELAGLAMMTYLVLVAAIIGSPKYR